ncbi:hypothetical protein GmHk_20G057048 [Glycine max]|nr:hypothetical protein GmHk_20G057048 [Glycine max]
MSYLTSKWALVHDKEGEDDKVCEKDNIRKKSGPNVQKKKKAQVIQKQNIALHVLSCGGYDFLEQKLMEKKKKKRLEEVAQSGSTDTVVDPPSPITQHVKWKMTHTKKSGQMTSEVTKEIIDKIVNSLEELASQGSFVVHVHEDVLTAAIGQPEHPGRVRATVANVMIKHYFGPASRGSRTSSSMAPKNLERLTQKITQKVTQQLVMSFS